MSSSKGKRKKRLSHMNIISTLNKYNIYIYNNIII